MSKGYTWDQIRSQVRSFRSRTQAAFPFHALTTIKDFHFDATLNKLYFLSNNQNADGTMSRHLTLYEVEYGDDNIATTTQSQLPALDEHPYLTRLFKFPLAEWAPVFTKYTTASVSTLDDDIMFSSSDTGGDDSNLHPIQGIAQYQMAGNKVLFSFNGGVYLGDVGRVSQRK
ncbi:hypothetical protein BDB00DRAFT_32393 [Zychaea mexicana]|uniref:uncharacterized protein n=1 Tax=Zychaea mexicana TaxID=64656 RepID=UPI0022FDBEA8|nr:uncharacterized protein BDB00DRAFT_32393 [Zychaea mexicana]KAI9488725.1 hypothetical protein BDB00DRAFT_32393 [Zychaea mexicana]